MTRPSDRMPRDTPTQRISAAAADLAEAWALDEMELWGRPETPDGLGEMELITLPFDERRKIALRFSDSRLLHLPSGRTWSEVHSEYTSPEAEEKWTPDWQRKEN